MNTWWGDERLLSKKNQSKLFLKKNRLFQKCTVETGSVLQFSRCNFLSLTMRSSLYSVGNVLSTWFNIFQMFGSAKIRAASVLYVFVCVWGEMMMLMNLVDVSANFGIDEFNSMFFRIVALDFHSALLSPSIYSPP